MRLSARSLASNMMAALFLAPLLIAAGLILTIDSVATGRIFSLLMLIDSVLPVDPDRGAAVLVASVLGCMAALLFAGFRHSWMFSALLILLGGLAEFYILEMVGLGENGERWVPALGFASVALSALNLRRAVS